MRTIIAFCLLICCWSCNGPMPITGNPDDHTTTTGTVGSAKSTQQLPPKPDNTKLPPDTLAKVKESLD